MFLTSHLRIGCPATSSCRVARVTQARTGSVASCVHERRVDKSLASHQSGRRSGDKFWRVTTCRWSGNTSLASHSMPRSGDKSLASHQPAGGPRQVPGE